MNYYIINTDLKTIGKSPHSLWIQRGYAYTEGPPKYGNKLSKLIPGDVLFVYVSKFGIVSIGDVEKKWDGKTYSNDPNLYPNPNARIYRIKVKWHSEMGSRPITASEIKSAGGHIIGQTMFKLNEDIATKIMNLRKSFEMKKLPEEIDEESALYEGAKKKIVVNAYERNVEARSKCLAHYGAKCHVCGMSFKESYGPEFEGIIHVHHLNKISDIKENYIIDPIRDLRPVCPNCHAAIHVGKDPLSIEYVKEKIRKINIAT